MSILLNTPIFQYFVFYYSNIATPQYSILQYFNPPGFGQFCDTPSFQNINILVINILMLQFSHIPILPYSNTLIIQYFNSLILKSSNSPTLQVPTYQNSTIQYSNTIYSNSLNPNPPIQHILSLSGSNSPIFQYSSAPVL